MYKSRKKNVAMEVIVMESEAFKKIMQKLDALSEYVHSLQHPTKNDEETWVTSNEICDFLIISERTLQRLRTNGKISYSSIGGKYYYQISEIKKLLQQRIIKGTEDRLQDLIKHSNKR